MIIGIDKHLVQISRGVDSHPGKAVLHDEDGYAIWSFDESMSDEQIMDAIDFANSVFRRGYQVGVVAQQQRAKNALKTITGEG